jgi:hypothetical protein
MKFRLQSEIRKPRARTADAYMMVEALVYIGVVFVLLGIGYMAMYRCIDNSVALRRNADDIANALRAGERWRADVRAASSEIRLDAGAAGQILHLLTGRGEIDYRFATGAVFRRVGEGSWVCLLPNVKASSMAAEPRQIVKAWRWELELQPQIKATVKPGRVLPLFTFLAVPQKAQ